MADTTASESDGKLVWWALVAAVVTMGLFVALAVGSLVFQPQQDGKLQFIPEAGEIDDTAEGSEAIVP